MWENACACRQLRGRRGYRWLAFCNPELSALITDKIGTDEWTLDMSKLRALEAHATDPEFQKQWKAVKQTKKEQLAALIKEVTGDTVDTNAMFDIHVRSPCPHPPLLHISST